MSCSHFIGISFQPLSSKEKKQLDEWCVTHGFSICKDSKQSTLYIHPTNSYIITQGSLARHLTMEEELACHLPNYQRIRVQQLLQRIPLSLYEKMNDDFGYHIIVHET